MTTWLVALEPVAPLITGAYRSYSAGRPLAVRRAVRRAGGEASTAVLVAELAAIATALADVVTGLSEHDLVRPGGEADWSAAQTVGHDANARIGLVLAASLAAGGHWPANAPVVVPGVPGAAGASREELAHAITRSQRLIERAARNVAGHETEPCPLEHPIVGHLRCGEWLAFAGVHDLMHLAQLHALTADNRR